MAPIRKPAPGCAQWSSVGAIVGDSVGDAVGDAHTNSKQQTTTHVRRDRIAKGIPLGGAGVAHASVSS
jgi:hypothetical protein